MAAAEDRPGVVGAGIAAGGLVGQQVQAIVGRGHIAARRGELQVGAGIPQPGGHSIAGALRRAAPGDEVAQRGGRVRAAGIERNLVLAVSHHVDDADRRVQHGRARGEAVVVGRGAQAVEIDDDEMAGRDGGQRVGDGVDHPAGIHELPAGDVHSRGGGFTGGRTGCGALGGGDALLADGGEELVLQRNGGIEGVEFDPFGAAAIGLGHDLVEDDARCGSGAGVGVVGRAGARRGGGAEQRQQNEQGQDETERDGTERPCRLPHG